MSASGSKIGKAQNEEMFSGLLPKADLGPALALVAPQPSINNTVDGLIGFSGSAVDQGLTQRVERVKAKSRVVSFRMDQATWDYMRGLLPFTRYRKASSFIREGIELLLKQEEEQRWGWSVVRPRRR